LGVVVVLRMLSWMMVGVTLDTALLGINIDFIGKEFDYR
jgi:hypothetical protein